MSGIEAAVDGVKSTIYLNRPSWESMSNAYPAENITSSQFYPMVSKAWEKSVQKAPEHWENTCATRMSYALNRSGIKLGKAPSPGGTLIGDDKFNYWIRVADLKIFLHQRFKGADESCDLTLLKDSDDDGVWEKRVEEANDKMLDLIHGRKGIIVFDVVGWGNATGHFTLWDGEDLVYVGPGDHNNPDTYEYYFWFTRVDDRGRIAQTKKITFWELK